MRNESPLLETTDLADADLANVSGGVAVNGGGSLIADPRNAGGAGAVEVSGVEGPARLSGDLNGNTAQVG